MKSFNVRSKSGWIFTCLTRDDWAGLWVPLQLLAPTTEADGKHPGFAQVYGFCDTFGESRVRRDARKFVKDHEL